MSKHMEQYDWCQPHLAWLGYENGVEPNRADLRDADLRDADLRGADLSRAKLTGANLPSFQKWKVTWRISETTTVSIGCKTKTITEWDEWFAGEKEYSTSRNTADFERIEAAYQHAKRMVEIHQKYSGA